MVLLTKFIFIIRYESHYERGKQFQNYDLRKRGGIK